MRMKKIFALVILFTVSHLKKASAQEHNKNKEPFEVFYKRADSINKAQPNLKIDDSDIKKLKELDKQQPYFFFSEATGEYEFKNDKYDYAAIVFYVGLIRYKYFMRVNPEYAPGEGWMICESMKQNYEDRIELYLKNNIEKYKAVLKFAIEYCTKNNYEYWQKPLDKAKFEKTIEAYTALLKELEMNKEKYEKQYLDERNINLGKASANSSSSTGEKRWYRYTPMKLDIDTVKVVNDVFTFYTSQRASYHYKYVKAKERLAILEFLNKKNWNDSVKLEIFKIVTYDEGEKNPQQDLYLTDEEFATRQIEIKKLIPVLKAQEKEREARVQQILGVQEGKKLLNDIVGVRVQFGEEFQKYFGK